MQDYTDIIKKVFADYFAFLKSGDYNYLGLLIGFTILILFVAIIIYFTYKN